MIPILIKKATIICQQSPFHLKKKDILVRNGIIEKIADQIPATKVTVIDKKGLYVSLGWMDIFANFCDPGEEFKEDIQSGSEAAAQGGFTDVCLIPNTKPSVNQKASIDYIKNKSGLVNLHPIGCLSANLEGKNLAEMYDMRMQGAIAFSDGTRSVQSAGLLLKALQYVKAFDGVVIQIPDDLSISSHGLMNEGIQSTQLGMQGKPAIAESIMVQRDIELAKYAESKIHFTGISTKASIDLIKKAKKEGIQVTCSVSPYHLIYTDNQLVDYNTQYKVNPPLRTEADRKALVKAVEEGIIDCIASHHMPQDWDAKNTEFEYAQHGMIGLQTLWPILLKINANIKLEQWINMLTNQPRSLFSMDTMNIKAGEKACLTIFNIDESWEVSEQHLRGKSTNTPLLNEHVLGKVVGIINHQEVYFHE